MKARVDDSQDKRRLGRIGRKMLIQISIVREIKNHRQLGVERAIILDGRNLNSEIEVASEGNCGIGRYLVQLEKQYSTEKT